MHFLPPPSRCSRGLGLVLGCFFGFVWVVFLVGFLFPGFVSWGLLMSLAPYTHLYLMRPIGFFDIQHYLYIYIYIILFLSLMYGFASYVFIGCFINVFLLYRTRILYVYQIFYIIPFSPNCMMLSTIFFVLCLVLHLVFKLILSSRLLHLEPTVLL